MLPEGEKVCVIIQLNNETQDDCLYEWLLPPYMISGIRIMPRVFEIKAKSYTTCIMQYHAAFRPYGPFSFEEVEKELIDTYDSSYLVNLNNVHSDEADTTGYVNPFIRDKVKNEIQGLLSANAEQDKKKKAPEKPKKEEKKLDPKKDKKQIEEEELRKKAERERLEREKEEALAKRVQEFDKVKELELFGATIESFDETTELAKSEHSKFVIPIFYKNLSSKGQLKKAFVEVKTTCVEKLLVFDKSEINFGEVSVKTRKTVNLTLQNKSDKAVDVQMRPLIVSNCFQIINAVREIPPNSSYNFIVEFYPLRDLPYYEDFIVYTNDTVSSIRLRGIGVQPEVSVNIENNVFFMGNTMVNNILEKSFIITNKSTFNINFEIKVLKSGKKNNSGYKPFCFIPYKGVIKASSNVPVKVSFLGDHQDYSNFFEYILVDVPNQKTPNYIFVSACCWYRQLYWRKYFSPTMPNEDFFKRTVEQEVFIDMLQLKRQYENDQILLEFTRYSSNLSDLELERTIKRKIIVGSCRLNDPKSEKNGTYEVILPVILILIYRKRTTILLVMFQKEASILALKASLYLTIRNLQKIPYLKTYPV